MKSGIYIDDQFIGVSAPAVGIYFDVVRAAIDSGESSRLTLPADEGILTLLITPHTRLRSFTAREDIPEETLPLLDERPFGNFPVLAREYLDVDDDRWEYINSTPLGDAIKALPTAD